MKIKEITYTNGRNDFKAIFNCPLCNYECECWGYSDENFYNNVMPNVICPKCQKNERGETEEELIKRTGFTYHI